MRQINKRIRKHQFYCKNAIRASSPPPTESQFKANKSKQRDPVCDAYKNDAI